MNLSIDSVKKKEKPKSVSLWTSLLFLLYFLEGLTIGVLFRSSVLDPVGERNLFEIRLRFV